MPQMNALMPEMIAFHEEHADADAQHAVDPAGSVGPDVCDGTDSSAMGDAFDASMNDDSFYLPPEVFDNPDFKRGMKQFILPTAMLCGSSSVTMAIP